MNIKYEIIGERLIVYLEGELDHHYSLEIRNEIDQIIDQVKCKELVLDFGKVVFMDSSGVGIVMGRFNKMLGLQGKVYVDSCTPYVDRILKMSGIYTIVPKLQMDTLETIERNVR